MKTHPIRSTAGLLAGLLLSLAATQSPAAEPADIEQVRATTIKLIDLLVEQGVLTRDKADKLLAEAQKAAPASGTERARPAGSPPAVRVPYVPEFVRKEIKDELRQELVAQAQSEGWAGPGAVPDWVRGLRWEGDLRLRLQGDSFAASNAPAVNIAATNSSRSVVLANTTEDRQRMRVRARMGVTAAVDEHWSGGVRLTTGSLTDPVSSNQTLGNYDNRFVAAFDRAYVRYRHGDAFNVVAGRFGNPWFGTDLVWANDLSFDGVAAQWTPKINDSLSGFLTLAALPIQEVELAGDKWLFGAQAGADLANLWGGISGKLGLGVYSYSNIVGQPSPPSSSLNEYTAPAFAQKGNTYFNISSDAARPLLGLASDYRILNLTGSFDIPAVAGKHVLLTGDFARNFGFDRSAVAARVGSDVEPMVTAYQVRVAFGDADVKQARDWQVFAAYKRLERDAVLDAFTDSDFRLGGTDAKGFVIGGSYGLGKNVAANLRFLSADTISGPPLSVDSLQFDLTLRF
ncbi:putative porin [Methylibium sp.]|uniref:putative porin n=1 Tax=Methylibium sp. TaxID=2067992 RepID=UPI003D0B5201